MTITVSRISLYLKKVKTLVNYHLKLRDKKNRELNEQVTQITLYLMQAEKQLRVLQNLLLQDKPKEV